MHKLRLFAVAFFFLASVAIAEDADEPLAAAQAKLAAGDLDAALQQLEPLLKANQLDQPLQQRVEELVAGILHTRGEEHFRRARIAESLSDFDRELKLQPRRAPDHWQRGIALYYAAEYEKGARQFKLHQTVNPEDVENAAWHFLCAVRSPKGSIDAARKDLIPVTRDQRVPMAQVQQLFAGKTTPEDVLRAGDEAGGAAKFYADLYVGLYHESLGHKDQSLRHISRAAENPAAKDGYMGDVARVHLKLRTKKPASTSDKSSKAAKVD